MKFKERTVPCREVIIRGSGKTCGKPVPSGDTRSINPVLNSRCRLHRICVAPLRNGSRCPNIRADVETLYCKDHRKQIQESCNELIAEYKMACQHLVDKQCEPIVNKKLWMLDEGTKKTLIKVWNETLDVLRGCHIARTNHFNECLHPTGEDMGHRLYRDNIDNYINQCEMRLREMESASSRGSQVSTETDDWRQNRTPPRDFSSQTLAESSRSASNRSLNSTVRRSFNWNSQSQKADTSDNWRARGGRGKASIVFY